MVGCSKDFPCFYRGMRVTSGKAQFDKNEKNMIGISIGGGAPYCPCLYVVQIFDNTPAAKEGSLAAGDELVGVNGKSVKGCSKVDVAKMIQSVDVSQIKYMYMPSCSSLKAVRLFCAASDHLLTYMDCHGSDFSLFRDQLQ